MTTQTLVTASQRQAIEFVVKPTEDLFLEGALRRIPRVSMGEAYPCQMQKNQAFSCLFRHYAKHNGLRREDLVFTFVDELLSDQTPEIVHLMPADEIFVSLRKQTEPVREPSLAEKRFGAQFKRLLETAVHCDVSFVLDNGNTHIPVHKAILTARSEYFEAMFSVGGMSESYLSEVAIDHNVASFRRMLEFIYTDEISAISNCSAEEILQLLLTAGQYCMDDLRIFAEPFAARLLSIDNIASFMLLSAEKDKSVLRDACIQFIAEHKHDLVADGDFYQEVESNPELGLLLFKYAINGDGPFSSFFSSQIADDQSRKRRRTEMLPVISSQPANGTITIAQSNASVHDLF